MDLQHMENGLGGGPPGSGGVGASSAGVGGGGGASDGVGGGGGVTAIEFQRLTQTISTSIQKILQNVSTMQRMVNQFNTPQDSPDLKKQLHQIMTYTHQLVSDTTNQLSEVGKCKERHLKIQRDRILDEFTKAVSAFQEVQRRTVEIEKNAVRQARAHSYNINKPPSGGGSSGAHNSAHGSNTSASSFFEDNFFTRKSSANQQQQQEQLQTQLQEDTDLQALEEQERAIRQLEENIVGVNDIYKKLGALVYEQGQTVDSIEVAVQQTSVFVSQGSDNLRKATSYKNKARKKKLILLGGLTLVLVVIILIIVMEFRN